MIEEYKGKAVNELSVKAMQDILAAIHSKVEENPDLEESEVTDIFVDEGFFSNLGYEGFGIDIRSEKHIVGKNRPDYFCKDKYGNVIFVIEFKKPSRDEDLSEAKNQLWEQYVKPLKADYGLLTDGREAILYKRGSRDRRNREFRKTLDSITESNIAKLENLQKPTYSFRSKETLTNYFSEVESVSIGEEVDGENVGQNEFFDTFRLEKNTIFYQMLEKTFALLDEYIENGDEGNFPKDAYDFWKEYYAPDPDDINWYDLPEVWRDIAGSADNKLRIIFAVETVQSLLGRLMLAKACEDFDFPNVQVSRMVSEETRDFRGEVEPVSYIGTGQGVMERMRQELVESVFEQDIYYWWNTPAEGLDELSAREISEQDWPHAVNEFSNSLIEFLISISRFDFSSIEGDPLGELYQQYFTREIRRALGEFYTPPSVADYIVDSVEYENNLQYKRLIDPACGSGTFLVAALRKYKQDIDGEDVDWATALKDLCEQSRVVGLDIHPFAVVLAQIRFMLEILPEYKQAVEEEGLVLKRLPIYRTDSLIDETEAGVVQQTFQASYDEDKIEFQMPLPIRKGSDFESMTFELPQFGHVQTETAGEIELRQHYFSSLLAVFDAVKEIGGENNRYTTDAEELETYFEDYFDQYTNIEPIANVFEDTANEFLKTVKELREDYNDGRLLKLIEDVVLSSTLKNSIPYDYVVGNPPWVSKHSRYSGDEREYRLKQQYLSAWKEKDMYMQFMERGLQMLRIGGTLGYIVSNRFLYNQGGQEIRALLAKNRIHELIDFTDYPMFEGATNYSAIVSVEKQVENAEWESFIEDGTFKNRYQFKATRVRDWDDSIPDLVKQIRKREPTDSVDFFMLDSGRFQERVRSRNGKVRREEMEETYTVNGQDSSVSAKLPQADVWPVASPQEFKLLDRIETNMDMRLGDKTVIRDNDIEQKGDLVGDDIRVGIQTSGDSAYIVKPVTGIAMEKLEELDVLTVKPRGIDKTYTVETDLLKVDITGEDADRWIPDWENRLVFIPYTQGSDRAELIRPRDLASNHEKTWEYFTDPTVLKTLSDESRERKEIHSRLAAEFDIIEEQNSSSQYRQYDLSDSQYRDLSESLRNNVDRVDRLDDDLWWYRFMYRKNIESLPKPKVLTGNQAQYNKLCFDEAGIMAPHNVRVYAIMLDDDNRYAVAGVLNAAVTEFYHKQHARIHKGKAYSNIKDYTSKWPVIVPEDDEKEEIEDLVERILHLKDLEIKEPQFPDPYIAEAREEGAEFVSVDVTPSKTFEADPSIQADMQQSSGGSEMGYHVELDDGTTITDAVDTKEKAEYVQAALKARSLEKNQTVSIPVPLSNEIAEAALDELAEDQEKLEETSVEELEQEMDEIVFGLYDIDEERSQQMIHRYNTQYKKIQPVDPGVDE